MAKSLTVEQRTTGLYFREGQKEKRTVERYYRNQSARLDFLKSLNSYCCEVCGFDFEKYYGERGVKYIQVHHTIPLNERDGDHVIQKESLAAVCANCHAMIHRTKIC